MSKEKVSRRGYVKYAAAGVVVVGVAAAGAYYATRPGPPTTPTPTPTVEKPTPTPTVEKPTPTVEKPAEMSFLTAAHSMFYYDEKDWKPIQKWSEKTGIKVNMTVDSFFVILDKIATTIPTKKYVWDVTYCFAGPLRQFAEYYVTADELGVEIDAEEINADIVPYCKPEIWIDKDELGLEKERWYAALPRMFEIFNLHANQDILDAKGQPFPTSYEEFIEVCKAVNEPDKGVYAFGAGLKQGYLQPVYCCFLHTNGGDYWADDDQRTVLPDSEESIKAVKDMCDLYDNYMNPGSIEWLASDVLSTDFLLGNHVLDLWYPNAAFVVIEPDTKAKNVTSWLWPGHEGVVRAGSEVAAESYSIPKVSPNWDWSWDLVQWLGSRETQIQMYLSCTYTPEGQEPVPCFWSFFEDDRFKQYPYDFTIKAQLVQSKYCCSRYENRVGFAPTIIPLEAEIINAMTKQKSPEDAMKDAREATDAAVKDEYEKWGGGWQDPWDWFTQDVQNQIDEVLKHFKDVPTPTGEKF